MLYFKVLRKNGYSYQCMINLDQKTIYTGYCLFIFKDVITLQSKKQLNVIINAFLKNGFVMSIKL